MKITVPSELKDIKLKDYQKYLKVVEDNPLDEKKPEPEVVNFLNINTHNHSFPWRASDLRLITGKNWLLIPF